MQRNSKFISYAVIVLLSGALAFAQEDKAEYRDVVLDGKPAKLNVTTGEVTFVNPKDKKKPVRFDDYVAKSNEAAKTGTVPKAMPDPGVTTGFHVVQEGETLLDVSKYYNVPLTKLKEANNLETTLISKGQVLRVKNFDSTETYSPEGDVKAETNYEAFKVLNTSGFHIVKRGETLYSIAKRYDLDLETIKHFNGIKSNIITIGQRLRLTNTDVPVPAQEANNDSVWTVSKGDTLFSIAKKNGLTVDALKQRNGLTNNTIFIGQKLQLD